MHILKCLAAVVFVTSALISVQASAAEAYTRITTLGAKPINLINSTDEATIPVGGDLVVHALIITNTDSVPVKVTLGKSVETSSPTGVFTKNISIVPANSSITIPFHSGLYLHKNSTSVYDDLVLELTTTSKTPAADFTFDYLVN